MTSVNLEFHPVTGAVGARVDNIDLSQPLDLQTRSAIASALARYGVLFFREQDLTPDQHIELAKSFGDIDRNRFFTPVDGFPEIAEVRKDPDQKKNIGGGWHTDQSYDTAPAKGSLLYAREVPPYGGDTMFASMYAAYDALSDGLKQTLESLNALHSSRHVFGEGRVRDWGDLKGRLRNADAANQDAVHPVVIRHPDSGRKALYVNPDFTVRIHGWTDAESAPLLNYLYEHAASPAFCCRFTWNNGSLAFWDNRATWHYAINDYSGVRRLMHRITIAGVPLSASGRETVDSMQQSA